MQLEQAGAGDLAAIASLMNRAYRGVGPDAGWTGEASYIEGERTSVAMLAADIAAKPGATLLVSRGAPGAAIAGTVWLEPFDGGTWYLGSLTVDPALQNTGTGRRLLAAAEESVRAQGGGRVRMTVVNVRDTLIAWYVRRGYRLTGEIEPWPYDDNRFGIPKRGDLAFVVLDKALGRPSA